MTFKELREKLNQFSKSQSPWKKIVGIFLIVVGFLALITPLTPGSWLAFIGLELLGIRFAIWQKIKSKF